MPIASTFIFCSVLSGLTRYNPVDFTLVTMALSNSDKTNCKSAMYQILALVSRSDNVTIKSEGTRVLVNVVKSLWSYSPFKVSAGDKIVHAQPDTEKQLKKEMSISQLFTPECAFALASLVGRSGRYPILVNEGIVAMSLLSTRKEAGMTSSIFSLSFS